MKGISFDVDLDKRLLAVVGPVGAGKVNNSCVYFCNGRVLYIYINVYSTTPIL